MSSLSIGDIAPRFAMPTDDGGAFDLYADDTAGHYVAIVFCPGGVSDAAGQLKEYARQHEVLRESRAIVIAASHEPVSVLAQQRREFGLPFDIVSDPEQNLFAAYGIANGNAEVHSGSVTLLVRPNQHVMARVEKGVQAEEILGLIADHDAGQREDNVGFPPILVVPDVLDRDECRRLIDVYENHDVPILEPDEFDDIEGTSDVKVKIAEYGRKDRMDHFIVSDDSKSWISERLRTRLLTEIRKAFNYTVTGFEALRIARYEGERDGEAHGHRDNSLPEVAHRRFAVSINLNAEDFEGGAINFSEYGPRWYRSGTGAATVFSCSMLHEASQVTRGRRYVLLLFLTGQD